MISNHLVPNNKIGVLKVSQKYTRHTSYRIVHTWVSDIHHTLKHEDLFQILFVNFLGKRNGKKEFKFK